jgi:hypothetical protein
MIIIYNKMVNSIFIFITYGTFLCCFCLRNEIHRLEEREDGGLVVIENNPMRIETIPNHIDEQV